MPRLFIRPILIMLPMSMTCALLLACGTVIASSVTPAATGTGSSPTGGSGSPGGGAPAAEPDPTGPTIFNVKLAPYSAKGDGITDDTFAIRSAITAACEAGGGEVWIPKGTYIISPQIGSDAAALTVSCDNLTLAGAGAGVSVLSRRTLGDTDPDKTCPMSNSQVNRGAGIWIAGKSGGDGLRHSFHMQRVSLLGNRLTYTGMTGNGSYPATQTNCYNVWDLSDKGLVVDPGATDVQILQSEIAYFSGELLYSGGGTSSVDWVVSGNNIHHSNGDGISVTAGMEILNNQIHDVVIDGIENEPVGAAQPQTIAGNTIYNIGLDAVNIIIVDPVFYASTAPALEVANNTITNAHRYGVIMLSRGGSIHDNQINDVGMPSMLGCGIAAIGLQAYNGTWEIPQNIAVQRNTIAAKSVITQCGIEVYTPAWGGVTANNISITGNTIGPMQPGANGVYMRSSIFIADGTKNVTMQNNTLY